MAQDPDSTPAEAIAELIDELLRLAERLGLVADHMRRAATLPSAEPRGAALRHILGELLERELGGLPVAELLDAAGIVGLANDAIDRDLLLVDGRAA
ncbi:MAG TPA: hypothetical protein VGO71_07155 [Baekduia sp.]|jgi:hypothetical protein|nr:hypothetical protein [Baekduia sp.]